MSIIKELQTRAKENRKRIVFPEPQDERMLKAAEFCLENQLLTPIIVGSEKEARTTAKRAGVDISYEIIDPKSDHQFDHYAELFLNLRKHKGMTLEKSKEILMNPLYYAAMMVKESRADASVAGAANTTGDVLRAAIQILGVAAGFSVVSSTFLMVLKDGRPITFADGGVVPNPTAEQLADIAINSADTHRILTDDEPIVALLSFSTKGSAKHELVEKVQKATKMAQKKRADLVLDGELQVDAALVESICKKKAPASPVQGKANVLIFPDLQAGNIAYKLVERLANATALGPIIQGLAKPANDLSRGCKVEDIINMACICSIKAQKESQ